MTDLEAFVALYKRFGINVNVIKNQTDYHVLLSESAFIDTATSSDKFSGYSCFYSRIEFNKDGKFITQGFWE